MGWEWETLLTAAWGGHEMSGACPEGGAWGQGTQMWDVHWAQQSTKYRVQSGFLMGCAGDLLSHIG